MVSARRAHRPIGDDKGDSQPVGVEQGQTSVERRVLCKKQLKACDIVVYLLLLHGLIIH